jgi:hypothetical protein
MSSSWIRKLVLAAALAVMPLHGIAATLTVLLCHGDSPMHGLHVAPVASHDHGDHAAAHSQEHVGASHDESGADSNGASYHLCCNLTASAPPSIRIDTALPDFPVRAFVPDTLHDLFVPEQPQRPPLA